MKLRKDSPSQTIDFELEIEGTTSKANPRLVLKGDSFSVIYEGKLSGKNASFEISDLSKLFEKEKSLNASIEVLVEGRYFKPWTKEIELEVPVSVKVTESVKVKGDEPTVKVAEPIVKEVEKKKILKENDEIKMKIGKSVDSVYILKILEENDSFVIANVLTREGKEKKVKIGK